MKTFPLASFIIFIFLALDEPILTAPRAGELAQFVNIMKKIKIIERRFKWSNNHVPFLKSLASHQKGLATQWPKLHGHQIVKPTKKVDPSINKKNMP
jgi:hypothetical protein